MSHLSDQKGSGHIVLIMSVFVLSVVGFAGYRVMKSQSTKNSPSSSATTVSSATGIPSKISTKAQAKQAIKTLDNEPIDKTLDSSQLNSELSSVL